MKRHHDITKLTERAIRTTSTTTRTQAKTRPTVLISIHRRRQLPPFAFLSLDTHVGQSASIAPCRPQSGHGRHHSHNPSAKRPVTPQHQHITSLPPDQNSLSLSTGGCPKLGFLNAGKAFILMVCAELRVVRTAMIAFLCASSFTIPSARPNSKLGCAKLTTTRLSGPTSKPRCSTAH